MRRLLDAFAQAGHGDSTLANEPPPLAEPLSDREHEVLILLAEGRTTAAVAMQLLIAESTVKWHIRNIYGKLGVASRVQAIVRARTLGLLP